MTDVDWKRYDLRSVAATVAGILGVDIPKTAEAGPIESVLRTLPKAERLALVVVDGFGTSVWQGVRDHVPVLNRLSEGHRVDISSVLLSYTYICISSMLTGISPASHGVTDLGAMAKAVGKAQLQTLFDTVREAGLQSLLAVHKRDVEGIPVSDYADYTVLAELREDSEIFSSVPKIIGTHRPAFAFVHLLDIDEAAHASGPASDAVARAAASIDSRLGALLGALAQSDYAVVVLADHGQHRAQPSGQHHAQPAGQQDAGPGVTADGGNLGVHDGSCEEDLRVPLVWASPEELRRLTDSGEV